MSKVTKITLEDRGQDFLEWYIRDGKVVDCQPFQGQVWVGSAVTGELKPGSKILVETLHGTAGELHYPIESVEALSDHEAQEVDGHYQHWLKILGQEGLPA